MREKSARDRLSDKLNAEYAACIRRWEATPFDVVMQDVEKLMAAKQIKSHLADTITEGDAALLLHKGLTLEKLVDQYGQGMDTQGLLRRCISPSSEMNFEPGDGPTVKELLLKAPGSGLDMMTPDGYVQLTPEQTKELLEGSSVQAHAGTPGTEVQTEADMILCQQVLRGGMENGVWQVMTDYPQMEQGQEIGGMTQWDSM